MRTFLLAILLTTIAVPAFAQLQGATGIPLNQSKPVSPEEQEKRRATEDAYQRTIKQIPNAKPQDPWGNMRGNDTPASGAAKKQTKKSTPPSKQVQ